MGMAIEMPAAVVGPIPDPQGVMTEHDQLLLVDDVYDTGLSLQQVIVELRRACGPQTPQIRIATPYFKPGNNRSGHDPDYFLHQTADWLVFPHELEGSSLAEMRANKPELAAVLPLLADRPG